MTEVSNQPLSDLVPQNQRRVSPETDPSPTELEREAVEALNLWGFEFDTIRDIIKTFRTMGLPDRHIPSYLRDRRHDFKGRSEALDSEQIEQYVTSRQDIVKKGYLPPIVFKTPQPQAPYPDPPASSNSGDDTSSSSNSERDLSLPDSLRDPCDHESCERDVCATDACEYGPGDPVSDEPNSNEGKIPHADDIDAPYPDEEPDDDDADRTSPADSSSPEKTPCDTSDDPNENEEADETKDKTEDSDTRWSDEPCEKARALIKACRERIDDDSIENLRNPHLEDGTLHLAISPPIKGVKLTLHNESQLLQAARIVWPNETIEAVEFEPMTGREDYRT